MKIKKSHGETSFRQELCLTVELLTKDPPGNKTMVK